MTFFHSLPLHLRKWDALLISRAVKCCFPISLRFSVVCPSSLLDLLPVGPSSVSGPCLCPFCRLCLPSSASFGIAGHILAFRGAVSLTMNATRSMGRRQGRKWQPTPCKNAGEARRLECDLKRLTKKKKIEVLELRMSR